MDEAHHYTLHIASYTPAVRLPGGKHDGAFRTKLQIAQAAGIAFKAILADRFYGDNYALGRTLLERWWTAELTLLGWCPNWPVRAVCVKTDRRTLLALSTWYPSTNLWREQALLGKVLRLRALGWCAARDLERRPRRQPLSLALQT